MATWQQHTHAEFVLKDPDAALATMIDNPYVLLIPSGTGGTGRAGVHEFYANQFLPKIPPDFELNSVSQIFSNDRISKSSWFGLRTRSIWIGCFRAFRPRNEKLSLSWSASFSFKLVKWPMSISFGIRLRSSLSWVSYIIQSRRLELAVRHAF